MVQRNTIQRLKILEYLKSVKTHPTAETVFKEVVKEIPTITLATVYRNLNLLADHGQVLRLEINGEYRYDGDVCFHQHYLCKRCGKMNDCFQEEISKFALQKFKKQDFQPECVTIIFRGICKDCKKRGE